MRVTKALMLMIAMIVVVGLCAVAAHADGDPTSKVQAPTIGGTPGVSNEFPLAPFGQTSNGCSFTDGPDGASDGTEDCTFKNQSDNNWTWLQITTSESLPCGEIQQSSPTSLFENATCTQTDSGDILYYSGVNYSPSTNALLGAVNTLLSACDPSEDPNCNATDIQTPLVEASEFSGNCAPSGSYLPGVLIGCDFEIELGPSVDPSDWQLLTSFYVVAPEPSTLGMLLAGLPMLPFALRRRKSVSA